MVNGKLKETFFILLYLRRPYPSFHLHFQNFSKIGKKFLADTSLAGPQLRVANYLTASLVVTGIIKWLSGEQIKKAPEPIFIDLWENL
jgi:hypothetical protein